MKNIGNITVSDTRDAEFSAMFGEQYQQRKALADAGIHVAPECFERTMNANELIALQSELIEARTSGKEFPQQAVAGRIANIRGHKKSSFIDLMDAQGRIQTFISHQELQGVDQTIFDALSRGDFLGVHGKPFATRTGEPSIHAQKLTLLGKALRMAPDIGAPMDQELQYRERFVHLMIQPEAYERFVMRSQILKNIRAFMDEQGFLEVETPMLDTLATGALAQPFTTYHNALDIECHMRIAPEIALKKLVIGGFEKVYEMGKQFRNEGTSTEHMQEFTTLEFYEAYANYEKLMDFTELWFREITRRTKGKEEFEYDGNVIDLSKPWQRKTFRDLIFDESGLDIHLYPTQQDLEQAAQKNLNLDITGKSSRGGTVDLLYKRVVRGTITQPTFILGHTADLSPLARRNDKNSDAVDRFQVVMAGMEVVNAYSELVDPIDQRIRFEEQMEAKEGGDTEAHSIDHEYLRAMEFGMPPIAGWGVGIDRLIMMLTNQRNIRDVVLFPLMRPRDIVKK